MSARRRDPDSLVTEVITDDSGFDRLGREWDELLDRSDGKVYFLRHHWNRTWWECYAPPHSRLNIVCCRDARGDLVGVAPLYWRQRHILGIPCARELIFLGMGIDLRTSEYLDFIAESGDEHAVAEAVAKTLKKRWDWDRIWFHQVPIASVAVPWFARMIGERTHSTDHDRAPFIDTKGGWEAFKRTLGKSMRRNAEYYARRFFKRYTCEFRRATKECELAEGMCDLVRLHQMRWLSSGQPGSFSDPNFDEFLSRVAHRNLPEGRVRLWTLRVNGNTEAALLGFLDGRVLHYFQKGYNPSFLKEDIGTVLLTLCIRDCCDDPDIDTFDFMGGGAAYKELWAKQVRETRAYEITRANLRASLHKAGEQFLTIGSAALRCLTPAPMRAVARTMRRTLHSWRLNKNAHRKALLVFVPTANWCHEISIFSNFVECLC